MNTDAKKQLELMHLLMERMDGHYTLNEEMEMEDRIETTRDTYTDLGTFLSEVNLGSSFVGLGYIQGYEAKKVYPTNPEVNGRGFTQADAIRHGFKKMDQSSRGWGKLDAMIKDPEFSNPTGRLYAGNRSMKNPYFAGVLKITNYVFNWGDASDWKSFRKNYYKSIEDTRTKFGFGKNDSDYAANDWRRNPMYHGIGAQPDYSGGDRNSYGMPLDAKNSLYGFSDANNMPIYSTRPDGTQYQKTAFKFGLKNIEKQWAKYCLVDNNGEIDDVDRSLGPILGKIPGDFTDLRKKITAQMSQEEQDFINAISEIDSNDALAKKTWLIDNIAYIVAGERSPKTGLMRYVRWINPNIVIDKFPVNQNELKTLVDNEIKTTEKVVRYKKAAAEEE